jgi:hypothetical protein
MFCRMGDCHLALEVRVRVFRHTHDRIKVVKLQVVLAVLVRCWTRHVDCGGAVYAAHRYKNGSNYP